MAFRTNMKTVPLLLSDDCTWTSSWVSCGDDDVDDDHIDDFFSPTNLGVLLRECCSINNDCQSVTVGPADLKHYKILEWCHLISQYEHEDGNELKVISKMQVHERRQSKREKRNRANELLISIETGRSHAANNKLDVSGNDFKTVNRTNLPKNASSQAVWREDRTLRIITDVRRPVSQGSVQPTAKHTKVQEKGTDQDRLNLAPLSRATSFQKLAKSTTTALMDRTPNVRGRVLSAPLQDKTKSVADASEESFLPANRGAISPTVAERRLKNSMELYLDGKSENKPTNRWFVPVLVAWRLSKQPEAPEKCSSLLRHMFQLSKSLPNCQPTLFAVNTAILCWYESNRENVSDHIGSLFRETKVHYKRGNINFQLGKTTYDMTLSAYARENNFDHAEAILWEMVDDFLDGNINAKPDLRHFNVVLNMYARVKTANATERAQKLLTSFCVAHNKRRIFLCPQDLRLSFKQRFPSPPQRSNSKDVPTEILKRSSQRSFLA